MADAATGDLVLESQLVVSYNITVASFAILYYDYLLTFSAEVDRFWRTRELTWVSLFFYLNRYLTVVGHIPVIFDYFWRTQAEDRLEICRQLLSYHQYLAVVIQVIVGIMLIMRTYALYDQSKRILLLLCVAGLTVIIFGTWSVAAGTHSTRAINETLPRVGCLLPLSDADAKRLAAAWTGLLCFDVLIFGMTLYKALTYNRGGRRTLLNVLLRDGAIYFGLMSALGLANILTFHLSPEYDKGFLTTAANIISSTTMSRLMLNLRDPKLSSGAHRRATQTTTDTLPVTTTHPVLSTFIDFETVRTDDTMMYNTEIPELDHDQRGADIELVSRTRNMYHA